MSYGPLTHADRHVDGDHSEDQNVVSQLNYMKQKMSFYALS